MHIAAKHPAADERIQYHSLLGSIKRIARLHLATPEFAYDLKVLAFFERERESKRKALTQEGDAI